jgi:hypothetical protein
MTESLFRILAILGSDGVAARIGEMLGDAPVPQRFDVTHCPSFSNWLETLNTGAFHAVIYIEAVKGDGAIEQIVAIRQRMPLTPLFIITRAEGMVVLERLRAGADDLLPTLELAPFKLARSLLVGIERKRREGLAIDVSGIKDLDNAAGEQAVIQEISDIVSAVGEKPLPVTSRTYLASDFSDQNPEKFEEFVQTYGKLIDDALDEASHRMIGSYRDSLAAFADSIGMLNLGPRDIIDIHKEVIHRKTRNANRTRMQAYINEGRLLLVQLMGNVLTFYRSFFWGCRVLAAQAARERSGNNRPAAVKTQKSS